MDPATLDPGEFRLQIPRFQAENWRLNQPAIAAFRAYATQRGINPAALAVAWVLAQDTHLIPIPGTRTARHLTDWVTASDLVLTPDDHASIGRIMPVGWAFGDRYNHDQAATVERYC